MFKHYLLMRYNIGLFSTNPYNLKDPNDYMVKRLPMFTRFLSSLSQQTNDNYTIVIGFDYETPDKYIDEVVALLDVYGINYKLVYEQPSEWIKRLEAKAEWLITSRIDNDDEYYPGFIDTIQNNFRERREVLDVFGVQCHQGVFYSSGRPSANSPFITLVEPWDMPKTVHHRPHSIMNGEYNARFVGSHPLYIQHIHDHNLANKLIGKKL